MIPILCALFIALVQANDCPYDTYTYGMPIFFGGTTNECHIFSMIEVDYIGPALTTMILTGFCTDGSTEYGFYYEEYGKHAENWNKEMYIQDYSRAFICEG
jgi:hypothetical protein